MGLVELVEDEEVELGGVGVRHDAGHGHGDLLDIGLRSETCES